MEEWIPELIPVADAEAMRFACNAVVLGNTVVTNAGCPEMRTALHARGFQTRETPLDEFLKAGGSAKCLTLHSTAKTRPRGEGLGHRSRVKIA